MIKTRWAILFLAISTAHLFSESNNRIVAYYQIQDYASALKLIDQEENQAEHLPLKLEILAKLGLTHLALDKLKDLPQVCDLEKKENFLTLESLAWSILSNQKNTTEPVQIASLVGAFLTNDAKAALELKKNLYSSNARLRAMAANFAANFQDPFLKEAIFQRLKEEKNTSVKKELIASAGKMRMKEVLPMLEEILVSQTVADEMKVSALMASISILDQLTPSQIQFFLQSERSYLKILGLRLLLSYEIFPKELFPQLTNLLGDLSPKVVQEALVLIGILSSEFEIPEETKNRVINLTEHQHVFVKALALWAQSRIEKTVKKELIFLCNHEKVEVRNFTVGLIGTLSKDAIVILKGLLNHQDPYCRLNAAVELLNKRVHIQEALYTAEKELLNPSLFMMMDESVHPYFTIFMPSKVYHHPFITAYPKVMDGMARLRLCEKIAVFDQKKIKEPLKKILSEKEAILTFYTLGLILQEDIENFQELKELIQDPNPSISLAATIALAFIGKEQSIGEQLIQLFDQVSFEEKLHILEAIGSLGDRKMIPFLLSVMQKPFTSLQIVAASSLIQCLYH
jgi:HEAT repeat protein